MILDKLCSKVAIMYREDGRWRLRGEPISQQLSAQEI
jgi:hypothetical protein